MLNTYIGHVTIGDPEYIIGPLTKNISLLLQSTNLFTLTQTKLPLSITKVTPETILYG